MTNLEIVSSALKEKLETLGKWLEIRYNAVSGGRDGGK
jgi:hypothetical protein